MKTLSDNGATLTDLITTLPENQRYTYVFNGVSQVLDHIFVTKPVTDVEYQVIHNNAEFADQASDHDQVVRIRPTVRQGTLTLDPAAVFVGQSTTVRLAWYPNRTFAVTLDGAGIGSVTTDAAGAGSLALPVTAATGLGTHTVKATATDGHGDGDPHRQGEPRHRRGLSPPKVKAGKQVKVEALRLVARRDADGVAGRNQVPGDGHHGRFGLRPGEGHRPECDDRRRSPGRGAAADGGQVTAALEVSR